MEGISLEMQEALPPAPQPAELEETARKPKGVLWYAGHILLYSFVPVAGPVLAVIHSTKAQPDPTHRTLARASLIITAALMVLAAAVAYFVFMAYLAIMHSILFNGFNG